MCFSILESDPCIPNPCKNGGVCVKEDDAFTCACDGTGYGGPTCRVAIIYFEPIPPVTMGTSFRVRLFTNVSLQSPKRVDVTLNRGLGVRITFLRPHRLYVEESFRGMTGIVIVSLPRNDINFRYEPRQRTVFISGGSGNETMSYFDQLDLPRGQLKPGCCMPDTDLITCPESTQTISFHSTCQWTHRTVDDLHRSPGIVFAGSLPTSISGVRYRRTDYVYDILLHERECEACDECDDDQYIFTLNDVPELFYARALAFTYIGNIQELLPPWLNVSVNLSLANEESPLTQFDTFAPITRHQNQISFIDGCSKLSRLRGSVYSVLRYDKTLSAIIDGQQYDYREDTATGSTGDPMCFAVDLCQGQESPVHIQISQPVNDILVSEYLHRFTSRQWSIHFNNVSVFRQTVICRATKLFWNGLNMILPPDIMMDISVNLDTQLMFTDDDLNIQLEFSGNAALNYRVSAI